MPTPNPTLSNMQARDMASLLHPFTNLVTLRQTGPLVLERGKGVFVYDSNGKDYLEAMGARRWDGAKKNWWRPLPSRCASFPLRMSLAARAMSPASRWPRS
jgi:hypothetical protein